MYWCIFILYTVYSKKTSHSFDSGPTTLSRCIQRALSIILILYYVYFSLSVYYNIIYRFFSVFLLYFSTNRIVRRYLAYRITIFIIIIITAFVNIYRLYNIILNIRYAFGACEHRRTGRERVGVRAPTLCRRILYTCIRIQYVVFFDAALV